MGPWENNKHRAPERASLVWHTRRRRLKSWFSRLLGRTPKGEESTSAEEWTEVSVRLANLGKHEEALVRCDGGLKISPLDSALWWNKSVALANLERHEESLACSERGLEINGRHSGLWNSKGAALAALGRHEESLACSERGLEINPRDSGLWNSKGAALTALGRHEEAMVCCDRGLEINPRDSGLWYNRGVALKALGRIREAEECLRRAEELARKAYPTLRRFSAVRQAGQGRRHWAPALPRPPAHQRHSNVECGRAPQDRQRAARS